MMSQSHVWPIVMSYIEEKFERKQLRHFSRIRSGLKIPVFSHIAPAFRMQIQKTTKANAKCIKLRSLIYKLVISKSVKISSS